MELYSLHYSCLKGRTTASSTTCLLPLLLLATHTHTHNNNSNKLGCPLRFYNFTLVHLLSREEIKHLLTHNKFKTRAPRKKFIRVPFLPEWVYLGIFTISGLSQYLYLAVWNLTTQQPFGKNYNGSKIWVGPFYQREREGRHARYEEKWPIKKQRKYSGK